VLQQPLVLAFGGDLDEPLVDVGPGQEDLDVDAAVAAAPAVAEVASASTAW
jgi:hypothetical protein